MFKATAQPVERLHALIDAAHAELGLAMSFVHRESEFVNLDVNRWKEAVLQRLMTEISPRLGDLVARVGCEVRDGLVSNNGGIRSFVGK